MVYKTLNASVVNLVSVSKQKSEKIDAAVQVSVVQRNDFVVETSDGRGMEALNETDDAIAIVCTRTQCDSEVRALRC